jgi:hypothetical protein
MRNLLDGQLKVYIERPDGTVIEMTGVATSLSVSHDIGYLTSIDSAYDLTHGSRHSYELIIQGTGSPVYTSKQWRKEVTARRTASEWMCDYCESPNFRKDRFCTQCGKARSFLYD